MSTMVFDKEVYNKVSQVKVVPSLVNARRMLEMIHARTDTREGLKSIVGYDCSLALNLLIAGNTSCYGHRGRVNTFSSAMAVLGFDRLKWVCLFSLMTDLLESACVIDEAYREILWKHSFVASKIAVAMTGKRPWIDVEEAFLLALTYDVGWLIMAACFKEQFEAIFRTAGRAKVPPWWLEAHYGLSHAEIGWYLAAQRALPESFKAVAAFHHCPEKSRSFETEATLICLVDALVDFREHPEGVNEKLTRSRCGRLFISEDEWSGYQESLEGIWSEADQLWGLLH